MCPSMKPKLILHQPITSYGYFVVTDSAGQSFVES